mmetsp:Transcript_41759/g.93867  ORF Transcript_41759/g.93867 Transcript_41759/m.93867 type:complete len:448 (+) Transcript_41759:154-1497(+)
MPPRKVDVALAPSAVAENAAAEVSAEVAGEERQYKVLGFLNLGLKVKVGSIYTAKDLEARCKGSETKLADLQCHMRDRSETRTLELIKPSPPPEDQKPAAAVELKGPYRPLASNESAKRAEQPGADKNSGVKREAVGTAPELQTTERPIKDHRDAASVTTAVKTAPELQTTYATTTEATTPVPEPTASEPPTKKRKENLPIVGRAKAAPLEVADSPSAGASTSMSSTQTASASTLERGVKKRRESKQRFGTRFADLNFLAGQVVWATIREGNMSSDRPAMIVSLPSSSGDDFRLKPLDMPEDQAGLIAASAESLRAAAGEQLMTIQRLAKWANGDLGEGVFVGRETGNRTLVSGRDMLAPVADMPVQKDSYVIGQLVWIWRCRGLPVWPGKIKAAASGDHFYTVELICPSHLAPSGDDIRVHTDSLMKCDGGSCTTLLDLIEEVHSS